MGEAVAVIGTRALALHMVELIRAGRTRHDDCPICKQLDYLCAHRWSEVEAAWAIVRARLTTPRSA